VKRRLFKDQSAQSQELLLVPRRAISGIQPILTPLSLKQEIS